MRRGSARTLGLNSEHLARLNDLDGGDRGRDERHEILKGIACTAEDNYTKLPLCEVLLELKISVSRDKDSEAGGLSYVEQCPILEPSPELLVDGSNFVPNQKRRELPRQLLIEQNAHAPLPRHGLFPKPRPPAPSTRLGTHRGIRRGCDCARDNRSGCGRALVSPRKLAFHPGSLGRCESRPRYSLHASQWILRRRCR